MADTVRLLSVKGRAQLIEKFYFYDGEVPIVDGVVEIPREHPEWVQRAYIMGYRYDPVSEEVLTLAQALGEEEVKSAESTGADVEDTDGGGQSTGDDGVRSSELESGSSLPEEGLDGSVSDGSTVSEDGDDTSDTAVQPESE